MEAITVMPGAAAISMYGRVDSAKMRLSASASPQLSEVTLETPFANV